MEIRSKEEYLSGIKRVLISEEEIRSELKKAGEVIDSWYTGSPLLFVSILKGSFIFLADLCRSVSVPCEISFMAAKSYYESTQSSGIVNITMDIQQDIAGRDVIIVEDIIDTGRTLNDVLKLLHARKPASLRVVTLLDKPERRIVELNADYSLFTIPDHFVIGYGLDYGEFYRSLPYIAEYNTKKENDHA